MGVNNDHYAIVVGLSAYPVLGDPPPSNLNGPVNDANDIRDWLIDAKGGGLPKANVTSITSPTPVPPAGAPVRDEIQQAFIDLADQAELKRTQTGSPLLGRRLYIYVSGHGFSPKLNQGCLLAGNAGGNTQGNNVFITEWLQQFQDAGYFFETVLWMDCCMNRDRDQASFPTYQPRVSGSPPGPGFGAFAARRPLRAVEQADSKGEFHGVFTTVLLEGLKGAAANPYGMVTGRSLADWLRNAQPGRLSPADHTNPIVSKEPEVLKEDQALVFGRGLRPTPYEVVLTITGGRGKKWKLWSGRPASSKAGTVPANEKVKRNLPPGLYVFEVPELRLRQGFEVTGPADLTIQEKGDPVEIGTGLVPITVDPSDPTAEIYLVDESFSLVDRDIGKLSTSVPPAIYKTRVRSGDRLAEQVYLLDRSPTAAKAVPELPAFSSAVPFASTAFTHEYHQSGLAHALDATFKVGAGAEILLMTRVWRSDDSIPTGFPADNHLELWDENKKVADIFANGQVDLNGDPYATLLVEVDPGNYFIRRPVGATTLEQLVAALPGWRTSYFFLVTPDKDMPKDVSPSRGALLMHAVGKAFNEVEDLVILQAQNAVGKGRAVLTAELEGPLVKQPGSPLAAILGGHMLILEQLKRPTLRIGRLKDLVGQLRTWFGPIPSGDVDALALSVIDPDSIPPPAGAPPMFQASWDLIAEASLTRPLIAPVALYQRVFAARPAGAFSAWACDAQTRSESLKQLKQTIAGETGAEISAADMAPGIFETLTRPPPAAALPAAGPAPTIGPGPAPPPMPAEAPSGTAAEKLKALGLPASALEL